MTETIDRSEHKNVSGQEAKHIGDCIISLGEMLLRYGGEVSRVEDTVYRLGMAYGFKSVDCLTIMNCIGVSFVCVDGESFTQMRRVLEIRKNMERIRACNALSREACGSRPKSQVFEERLRAIEEQKGYAPLWMCLIYMLTSASMTLFFGGGPMDAAASALAAIALYFSGRFMDFARIQNFVTSYIEAFMVGASICLLIALGIGKHYDLISMGNIMLMISGSGLMTSVRDMINNDLLSGMMGFLSAVIGAAAIALGFVSAALLFL